MDNCTFCQIIARRTHAEILYENDDALCILDINPIHFGHTLVIPKRHCRDFIELPPESFSGLMQALHTIAKAGSPSFISIFTSHPATLTTTSSSSSS